MTSRRNPVSNLWRPFIVPQLPPCGHTPRPNDDAIGTHAALLDSPGFQHILTGMNLAYTSFIRVIAAYIALALIAPSAIASGSAAFASSSGDTACDCVVTAESEVPQIASGACERHAGGPCEIICAGGAVAGVASSTPRLHRDVSTFAEFRLEGHVTPPDPLPPKPRSGSA